MLARFQILFSLLALLISGTFAISNTATGIVTAPISTGTGSGSSTANSTILASHTPTPSSIQTNGAGSSAGYLNAAVVGVVAMGAAFVSL